MMDNDNSLNKRPTFKRALRNISMRCTGNSG
ncbi:hypothetical protein M9U89_19350, partial [Shigella sonnei]|nr:hypothetical protein [Shigella sonnei]